MSRCETVSPDLLYCIILHISKACYDLPINNLKYLQVCGLRDRHIEFLQYVYVERYTIYIVCVFTDILSTLGVFSQIYFLHQVRVHRYTFYTRCMFTDILSTLCACSQIYFLHQVRVHRYTFYTRCVFTDILSTLGVFSQIYFLQ